MCLFINTVTILQAAIRFSEYHRTCISPIASIVRGWSSRKIPVTYRCYLTASAQKNVLTQLLYFLKPGNSTPDHRLTPYIASVRFQNFQITLNYQTFYLHMIVSKVIYQHHFVLVLQQTSPYFRNQEANQVNIPTVRTKTSGSNSIKSKSANIWKFLQIFINRLFYNGICLTVPLLFIIYLFFFCLISVGFTSSCIYVFHH